MGTPFPVSVRFGASPQAFVIDAGFALSPMGLLVTMSLARSAAVWLPRGLLTLLDNDRVYRRAPDQMGGHWLPPDRREAMLSAMAAELPAWQRAWHYGKLAARVHWIGDARYESALADREDASLLPRFEHCASALDARLAMRQESMMTPLDECARDAIALAAALQPEPVLLITLPSDDPSPPPLCRLLDSLGIGTRQRIGHHNAGLAPLIEAALVPLEAAGEAAALVQIVAPDVLTLPDSWPESWPGSWDGPEWSGDDGGGHGGEEGDDVWRHACALWHPLVPLAAAA